MAAILPREMHGRPHQLAVAIEECILMTVRQNPRLAHSSKW
jgi:hypothetical protein